MKEKQATIQDLEELPPFHAAARQGDAEELAQLLAVHPDLIDYGDGKGFTALMHAIFAKSMSCLKILLQFGSKPETKDSKGRSALHFCARKGWREGAEFLIKYGAFCNTADSNARNALHYGACSYEESCLEALLRRVGSETINKADCEGMTPLHWASFHDVWENVDILLKNGADPTIVDKERKTALHWAAQNGCSSACKILLSSKFCKIFINEKTNGSKTALHLAAIGGHLDVIFELAQGNDFDADVGDQEKRTALHWACAVGSDRCVAGLLRLGVKHDMLDEYGITPLTYAKKLGHHSCVMILESFDSRRPQDVLIPMESLSGMNNSIEKAADHKASLSDLERDVFLLIPSTEKEQSHVEKIVQLQQQTIANNYKMRSLAEAIGEVLDREKRDSDSEFVLSDDEANQIVQISPNDVLSDAVGSEDESRSQPQMALTPPNAFLHNQMDTLSKRKGKQKEAKNSRKISKQVTSSPYQLAPIRTKGFNQQDVKLFDRSSSREMRSPSSRSNARKRSTHGAAESSNETTREQMLNVSNINDINGKIGNLERPLGLRRKSLSMNDGLVHYASKTPEKVTISRTQSFAQIRQNPSRLPVIDIRDGRNLTQRIHLDQRGVGYQDQTGGEHVDFVPPKEGEKKRRKVKRKQRPSRYER